MKTFIKRNRSIVIIVFIIISSFLLFLLLYKQLVIPNIIKEDQITHTQTLIYCLQLYIGFLLGIGAFILAYKQLSLSEEQGDIINEQSKLMNKQIDIIDKQKYYLNSIARNISQQTITLRDIKNSGDYKSITEKIQP